MYLTPLRTQIVSLIQSIDWFAQSTLRSMLSRSFALAASRLATSAVAATATATAAAPRAAIAAGESLGPSPPPSQVQLKIRFMIEISLISLRFYLS